MNEGAASKASERAPNVAVDPTEFLFHLFIVLSRYRDAGLDKVLKPLGLNVSRHRALAVIASFEPCTMGELSDFSCVYQTNMTRTVDQLVAGALSNRFRRPPNCRQLRLTLKRA